jgi:hypothetical protein
MRVTTLLGASFAVITHPSTMVRVRVATPARTREVVMSELIIGEILRLTREVSDLEDMSDMCRSDEDAMDFNRDAWMLREKISYYHSLLSNLNPVK